MTKMKDVSTVQKRELPYCYCGVGVSKISKVCKPYKCDIRKKCGFHNGEYCIEDVNPVVKK